MRHSSRSLQELEKVSFDHLAMDAPKIHLNSALTQILLLTNADSVLLAMDYPTKNVVHEQ